MYLTGVTNPNNWVADIEADDLNPTVVFVLCAKNVVTKEKVKFTDYEQIRQWSQSVLNSGGNFIGHNFLAFDAPALNRIVGTRIPVSRIIDTFILSMLFSPALQGGHSLEAWGERLGCKKKEFEDFSHLSDEMVEYCEQDVEVNWLLYTKLAKRMLDIGFTDQGPEIEHKMWHIIQKQKKNGFYFDQKRASLLLARIRSREQELREEIYGLFPPIRQTVRTFAKAFKSDGSPTVGYLRHQQEYPELRLIDGGGYEALADVEFNLGSPKQRIEKLIELGWKPTKLTAKGSPQVDEDSLVDYANVSGKKEIAALAKWISLNGRGNAITNWLDLVNPETGCIHGNLWLASTLRYRHDKPNTANIPAVRMFKDDEGVEHPIFGEEGVYTYEARDLWTTRDRRNRSLVGVDAKGIQLRVLANYVRDQKFTEAVLSGDPHSYNASLIGLPRPKTKTFTYALIMGGGDGKLGAIAGGDASFGRELRGRLESNLGDFGRLVKSLKGELSRSGRITLCDGSKVGLKSDHMVIPYLLQGDESRLMKQAAIYLDEKVRRDGLDVLKVGDIHDEWQSDVANSDRPQYIKRSMESFIEAGETFNYNLPIEGDAKYGLTWAETH